jgi:xanthine dehydrogenase molybdopterin-binding subunit B
MHAAILRSPYAHATIRSIDTNAAKSLDGVQCVLTAADLGDLAAPLPQLVPHATLKDPKTPTPLAVGKTRYEGEPVAIVVARDRYVAEDALDLIQVDYEFLPPVTDLEAALGQGGPLVHEETGSNVAADFVQVVGQRPTWSSRSGSSSIGGPPSQWRAAASWQIGIRPTASSSFTFQRRPRFLFAQAWRKSSVCRSTMFA